MFQPRRAGLVKVVLPGKVLSASGMLSAYLFSKPGSEASLYSLASNTGMPEKNVFRKEGLLTEALPGATFRVRCDDGTVVLAHLSGRMRVNRIRLIPGDRVILELPALDATRGRIVYRK